MLPAFIHIRRGGSRCTPTAKNRIKSNHPYSQSNFKMFAEIPAAISAIKESLSLFNTIKDANNQAEINNAVVDITTKLNSILLENTRLLEIINEKQKSISLLEKALAEEETKKANEEKWALESLNYEAWNQWLERRSIDTSLTKVLLEVFPIFAQNVICLVRRLSLAFSLSRLRLE